MDNNSLDEPTLEAPYLLADGPEGLRKTLEEILAKVQEDKDYAVNGQFILYRLGNQRSVIKVDLRSRPIKFWYNDLLGRPATQTVKKTIALFLMEKCGEKAENLKDLLGEQAEG